ncbi:YggS family pyridoxal phosphate-dependent enzyme [Parafannyhessea umbonata]|uniref:YggS family pyridoxal phosphate-dependent enzyme n=1 Tax=Parafannyhessea TaxID=2847312 RepID=UPI0015641157|nr:YggS family pyridoxal phosphate-dependent enzyme [Parafannyhessea umbonata]MBM6988535.1 YggS family pyridoxal phosphate-dependent enzyme [Parafannyhessea umbonata]MCI6681641.1 YggS family pyridoxal phosphate-dependent enzyme [Parafannyhessea umbonata]MCI7219211.1 YggS family pyridoxal phosphate-dependent enzyme [Parafannyhessea umbonata]MDD6359859.1 YggS family pyridoxal phosphate-dependent enzyme [Parafannyhessea umbonata]MDD6566285.1 YggS family pyridoxal phosphate-dependent enzyme [Paraf
MTEEERSGYLDFLRERREQILQRVADACRRAGRTTDDVTILGVSKTVGVDEVALAWQAGWHAFAENRPQELTRKLEGLREHPEMSGVRFDMIGNLQTNKINQVIGRVGLIHSISSGHLAEAVSKRSVAHGIVSDVLLEVNVSGEESKSGFAPAEVTQALDGLLGLPGIRVRGLMTMAPAHDADAARRTFSGLRELRDELSARSGRSLATLSAGMSDDFQVAIEEGSTIVRLGRTLFSPDYDLR